jgi:hypothetical protein
LVIYTASEREREMTDRPTVAERIDPASPHYDAKFAEMRRSAFAAFNGHEHDMKTNAAYRKVARRVCK